VKDFINAQIILRLALVLPPIREVSSSVRLVKMAAHPV
jgi:hypothetical protein